MSIADIILMSSDLPAWHVAGEFKLLEGDHAVLRNVGGATALAIQWIGTRENKAAICGEVTVYLYPTLHNARRFFARFISDFTGEDLTSVGERGVMAHDIDISAKRETTSIRFLRHLAIVAIRGWTNVDPPSFARNVLTRDVLVRYAERLDGRLLDMDG